MCWRDEEEIGADKDENSKVPESLEDATQMKRSTWIDQE